MCFYAKFPSTKVLSTKYLSILNFLYYKDVIDSHMALIGIFQNVFGRWDAAFSQVQRSYFGRVARLF